MIYGAVVPYRQLPPQAATLIRLRECQNPRAFFDLRSASLGPKIGLRSEIVSENQNLPLP
jgi:hypothetical protein